MSYKQRYKSDVITVTTSATTITPTGFDMNFVSIYPTTGSVEFRVMNQGVFGDWIQVPQDTAFEGEFEGSKIEIRSESGSVSVNYFIKGLG